MVGIALLMAMVIVLQFVSSMIPPIGFVSISLVLIPIVLGACIYGVGAGAILGATFAVVTIINCVTGADAGGAMIFQANPLLCIVEIKKKSVPFAKGTLLAFKAAPSAARTSREW